MTLTLAVALPLAIRRWANPGLLTPLRKALAGCLLLYLTTGIIVRTQIYGLALQEHLPLHLCGASIMLGAIMLWRASYPLYEIVYFWGIGGAIAALLTPDLPVGFPHPFFLLFFIGHGLAVTTVLFATIVIGFRPRAASVGIAIAATAGYALLIYPVNLLLGSNYLYLLHKPERPSPLDYLGPWPWYILGLAAITVIACALCYLPFAGRAQPVKPGSS